MDQFKKLYFTLGLLLAAPGLCLDKDSHTKSITLDMQQSDLITENQTEQTEIIEQETPRELSVEEQIDEELYEVFEQFFNDKDQTPFTKIVMKVINLLKRKKLTLNGMQLVKCDEIIKILEKNKANYNFPAWAKILINPDLLHLMSESTRSYIHNVSSQKKITTLIRRLKTIY